MENNKFLLLSWFIFFSFLLPQIHGENELHLFGIEKVHLPKWGKTSLRSYPNSSANMVVGWENSDLLLAAYTNNKTYEEEQESNVITPSTFILPLQKTQIEANGLSLQMVIGIKINISKEKPYNSISYPLQIKKGKLIRYSNKEFAEKTFFVPITIRSWYQPKKMGLDSDYSMIQILERDCDHLEIKKDYKIEISEILDKIQTGNFKKSQATIERVKKFFSQVTWRLDPDMNEREKDPRLQAITDAKKAIEKQKSCIYLDKNGSEFTVYYSADKKASAFMPLRIGYPDPKTGLPLKSIVEVPFQGYQDSDKYIYARHFNQTIYEYVLHNGEPSNSTRPHWPIRRDLIQKTSTVPWFSGVANPSPSTIGPQHIISFPQSSVELRVYTHAQQKKRGGLLLGADSYYFYGRKEENDKFSFLFECLEKDLSLYRFAVLDEVTIIVKKETMKKEKELDVFDIRSGTKLPILTYRK